MGEGVKLSCLEHAGSSVLLQALIQQPRQRYPPAQIIDITVPLERGIIQGFALQGITATVGARHVAVGNLRLLAGQCSGVVPADLTRKDGEWRAQGKPWN